nr:MAG TPA: hypothetical protein [Caudoviricetes sp.]
MLAGGNLNNGLNCGTFYVNVNNDLSNSRFNNGSLGMLFLHWTLASLALAKNF